MIGDFAGILTRALMASVATVAFSIMFYIPKKELAFAGLTAGLGWLFNELVFLYAPKADVTAAFAATAAIAVTARVLSYLRKSPVILYLVAGIIPIVPGAGIYYTMYESIINGQTLFALEEGIKTLKIAGVIAFAIFAVLSLPRGFFDLRRKK